MFKRLVTTLFVLQSLFVSTAFIQAQTLSLGCNGVNDVKYDGLYAVGGTISSFFKNEQVEISVDVPISVGIPTQANLWVNGISVDTVAFPGFVSYRIPADGNYSTSWFLDTGNVTWDVSCRFVPPSDPVIVETCPVFFDGRINNCDTATPIAVYPHDVNGETGLIIYAVDGEILLIISPQQLANIDENPESPILIVEESSIALYRIPGDDSGQWQINAPQYNGKTYVLIFSGLFADAGYISFEED